MSLCKGCQELTAHVLDPERSEKSEYFTIHANFAELSECADAFCDLCKFFRRELCYHTRNYVVEWTFSDKELQDKDSAVVVVAGDGVHLQLQFGESSYLYFPLRKRRIEDRLPDLQGREYIPTLDSSLELAREWLRICCIDHAKCGPQIGDDTSFLPTRLLDVGQAGQKSIRLVISGLFLHNTETISSYVTLSYCWGQAKNAVCTTKENMEERLHGILISSLPQTLQDAVDITRALDVRYLWIDALCIIQVKEGKNEDWERELANMGKIYKHSLLTIAASSARDSSVGCFYRREASLWPVQHYRFVEENNPHRSECLILLATIPSWKVPVENSVLNSRGWVLQERFLASRTLFWTDDGLFWQCSETRITECGDIGLNQQNYSALRNLAEGIDDPRAWTDVLTKFTRKTLTVETDRLPAVEGLMSAISRVTGKEHEMGVWKQNVIPQLAWMVDFPVGVKCAPPDPQVTRLPGIPSWSWASVNQKLDFRRSFDPPHRELAMNVYIHAQQVRARVRMGNLHLRRMETKSGVYNFYWKWYLPHSCMFQPVEAKRVGVWGDDREEIAVFDTLADAPPAGSGSVKCIAWTRDVLIPRTDDQSPNLVSTMMVTPVDEEKNIYRRIGWADLVDDRVFEQEYQDITLV